MITTDTYHVPNAAMTRKLALVRLQTDVIAAYAQNKSITICDEKPIGSILRNRKKITLKIITTNAALTFPVSRTKNVTARW